MSNGRQFGPFVATFSPSNGFNWKYHGEAAIVAIGLRLHERSYLESQDIPERGIRHSQTFDADAFSNGYCWISWHQPWISTRQQTTNAIDRVVCCLQQLSSQDASLFSVSTRLILLVATVKPREGCIFFSSGCLSVLGRVLMAMEETLNIYGI